MMSILSAPLAAFAVATVYYVWRDAYYRERLATQKLHKRVAYMLWVAAQRSER
jgi:hypothetical protein